MTNPSNRLAVLALALALTACGKDEPAGTTADAPAADAAETAAAAAESASAETAAAPTPPPAAPEVPPSDAPITTADLDVYARGVAREIEILGGHVDALKKAREAKDDAAELAAMVALGSEAPQTEAANVAGVDPARYAAIKAQVDDVLSTIDMQKALAPQIEAMEKADMSGFTDEQKQQASANIGEMKAAFNAPYDKLPEDVREAFRAREAELAKLRSDALAARLSALGG